MMKINLKITYDDLSDECKDRIKMFESLGYKIDFTYPEVLVLHDSIRQQYEYALLIHMTLPIQIDNDTKSNIDVFCKT